MFEFSFSDPLWFLAFLLLIPMVIRHRATKNRIQWKLPSTSLLKHASKGRWRKLSSLPFLIRILVLSLIIIALARPQVGRSKVKRKSQGIDMMLVIDTSGSMKALDFVLDGERHDRLYVVKSVLRDFIKKRTDDRMGMVVFGTHAFSQAPLTLDHDVLLKFLSYSKIGIAGDATAIGEGIGVATNRLKDVKSKSKVIILLTDGANTAGSMEPLEAVKAAKAYGIKIYTIAVGSSGSVPIPTRFGIQNVTMKLDEKLLKKISEETGGQYFLASNTEKLQDIYATIDKLEKTEIKVDIFHNFDEKFFLFLFPALFLLLLESALGLTRFRRLGA